MDNGEKNRNLFGNNHIEVVTFSKKNWIQKNKNIMLSSLGQKNHLILCEPRIIKHLLPHCANLDDTQMCGISSSFNKLNSQETGHSRWFIQWSPCNHGQDRSAYPWATRKSGSTRKIIISLCQQCCEGQNIHRFFSMENVAC